MSARPSPLKSPAGAIHAGDRGAGIVAGEMPRGMHRVRVPAARGTRSRRPVAAGRRRPNRGRSRRGCPGRRSPFTSPAPGRPAGRDSRAARIAPARSTRALRTARAGRRDRGSALPSRVAPPPTSPGCMTTKIGAKPSLFTSPTAADRVAERAAPPGLRRASRTGLVERPCGPAHEQYDGGRRPRDDRPFQPGAPTSRSS